MFGEEKVSVFWGVRRRWFGVPDRQARRDRQGWKMRHRVA